MLTMGGGERKKRKEKRRRKKEDISSTNHKVSKDVCVNKLSLLAFCSTWT